MLECRTDLNDLGSSFTIAVLKAAGKENRMPAHNGRKTDTRVIAATNRSIDSVKNNYLREDLFYRLAVIVIELPPLRDRKEDIPLLIENFVKKFNEKYSNCCAPLVTFRYNRKRKGL